MRKRRFSQDLAKATERVTGRAGPTSQVLLSTCIVLPSDGQVAEDEDDIMTKCAGRTCSIFPEVYRGLFCPGPPQDGQDIVGASFRLLMVLSSQAY